MSQFCDVGKILDFFIGNSLMTKHVCDVGKILDYFIGNSLMILQGVHANAKKVLNKIHCNNGNSICNNNKAVNIIYKQLLLYLEYYDYFNK